MSAHSPSGISRRALFQAAGASPLAMTAAAPLAAASNRRWPLGINTYCLRFQRWNDRQLLDYCVKQGLDSVFLQDSIDPGTMDPKHWAEVRTWAKEAGLKIETGGGSIMPKNREDTPRVLTALRKNIERAKAMGSPIVRANLGADRYSLPPGSIEQNIETAVGVLKSVRSELLEAGLKIAIENHKEMQAWQTRLLLEQAGKDIAGSYLDTGNPVFVADDPATFLEELAPFALSFHLRDSVVYEHPDGIAIQWVPLGEGTVDFKALVARAAEILPAGISIYCKPITARPPVVLPVYQADWWAKWFPTARSKDFARFLALAKRGKPYDKPHLTADVAGGDRERYMDALKVQQMDHMERSLAYCRKELGLGLR